MRHWFADGLFRSVLKNAGYLGAAKLLAAPLGLAALAWAGRGSTPALFGVLMVIHSYAESAGAIVKFQSWQLVIRYGGPALARGDEATARDAIRFALGLDIASGLIGMVAAMAALPLLAGWLGLSGIGFRLAFAYCLLVPTMTAATPTGVLRLLDRFDLIGVQQLATPVLRAAGAGISYFGQLGFVGFVATWFVADLAGDLVTWFLAARELRRRGMGDALRPGLRTAAARLPDSWSFAWTTNVGHSVWAAWGPLSNIVVAGILGPAAAGLYAIAATLLEAVGKASDLMGRGFYPEIMRLDPASRAPWQLGLRTAIVAGMIGVAMLLLVLIGGGPVIAAVFGRKYLAADALLALMVWGLAVQMASFPLESLLYMVGRQRAALVARSAGTLVYLALLAVLSSWFGLTGAGIAYLFGTVILSACMLTPVIGSYRRRNAAARAAWDASMSDEPLPPIPLAGVIAIVGSDGAGKSTLMADLAADLCRSRTVASLYLGQGSGNIMRGIGRLPLVGAAIGRFLKRRGERAHADDGAPAPPDVPTAIVVRLLSRRRVASFRRLLALHRRGVVVIADRWPQAEVPGFYFDGPGLSADDARHPIVRRLAAREARAYRDMARHHPALIVRLNIDAETAHARKPDHKLPMLREKARVIPTLAFGGAAILDLDARAPYAEVRDAAIAAARRALN